MNPLHDVDRGTPDKLSVIIEIPAGSHNKYELDKETGLIKLDRVMHAHFAFPANYGFVPRTLWEDGDPLDVFVVTNEPLPSGCLVEARPVGILEMTDSGEGDSKIIAVACDDAFHAHVKDVKDLGPHFTAALTHFYEHYKDLQKKKVVVEGMKGHAEAVAAIEKGFSLYDKSKKKH